MRFACTESDHIFLAMVGVNDPKSITVPIARLNENAGIVGRKAGCLPLTMVCTDESSEAAYARWAHYSEGTDYEALAYASGQASMDRKAAVSDEASAHQLVVASKGGSIDPKTLTNTACMGMGVLVGSYADVAKMLDEAAEITGVSGLMVALADWETDTEKFCKYVEPLMKSRAGRRRAA
jgi:pyrimidine oxygenase